MGEGACQHDISWRPSYGPILTYETIFASVGGPKPKLHPEVLDISNVCEGIVSENVKHLFA